MALEAAVAEYFKVDLPERSQEQVAADLFHLGRLLHQVKLAMATVAGEFVETDEFSRSGRVGPGDWIRVHCNLSRSESYEMIRVGQMLRFDSDCREAILEGRIGYGHLSLIESTTKLLASSTVPDAPTYSEQLIHLAEQSTVGQFWHVCQDIRHAADPARYTADQVREAELRSLRFGNVEGGGGCWFSLLLDPEGAATLKTALRPLARKAGGHDDRSYERRWADAVIELAMIGMNSGDLPQQSGQRAHLQVSASLETLLGRPDSPAGYLELAGPISGSTVQRFACDCTFTRVLLDSRSGIIDVGRAQRVVRGATRKALVARDQGCRWPGCDRSGSWCEGHHLKHWINGGRTDLPNLILLCYRHHWLVHEGGWRVERLDGGQILTLPPQSGLHLARAPAA